MGKKKVYRFTLIAWKQADYWRGAVSGAMWAFGRTLPAEKSFSWWWGYENGQQSWTCKVECIDYELFSEIKKYIDNVIPGDVFDWSRTD